MLIPGFAFLGPGHRPAARGPGQEKGTLFSRQGALAKARDLRAKLQEKAQERQKMGKSVDGSAGGRGKPSVKNDQRFIPYSCATFRRS
jgi:hypothetical protein